jgi:hypothetical protein
MNTSHNGFSNVATWIVFRDICSNVIPQKIMGTDRAPSIDELSRALRLVAVDQIFDTSAEGFARDCAMRFLEDVSFYQIASVMFENYYEETKSSKETWIRGSEDDDDEDGWVRIPSAAELS